MSDFVIMADSTCDLPEEFQKKYDVIVLPGHVILPDKSEVLSRPKWEYFKRESFYEQLRNNPDGFVTAPPNVSEFTAAYEEYAKQGKDILCLTISSGISGAFNFSTLAREAVLRKYPNARIINIDSMRFGPGFGLMVVYAATLRSEGLSIEDVAQQIETKKNTFHQAGWLDDLSFVAKKGRITHAKAFFGSLAGVKPIGEFDYNGLTTVIGKAKGAKSAYAVLLQYIEQTIVDPKNQIIFIAQSNRLKQAEQYKQMILEKFHPKEIYINDVFPSCGVNIGPGLMAAYYMGTPISKDLSREREILEKAMNQGG